MVKYRDISMEQRLDKIGELLAKGVYLYLQKQKEGDENARSHTDNKTILPEERSRAGAGIAIDAEVKSV